MGKNRSGVNLPVANQPTNYCSMDTARYKIKEVCEQEPNATITMVISRGDGSNESFRIVVNGTAADSD